MLLAFMLCYLGSEVKMQQIMSIYDFPDVYDAVVKVPDKQVDKVCPDVPFRV
jgi:hypothetical protein